ncbi:MAG: GNAT family N-acetyltransferase, partial [Candidatus Limnocylindrales bacterium]
METGKISFLIRPIRPEECAALGELTVAAYHSIPAEMPHQETYDLQLRDVARRARTSCVLVAVGPAGELLGGVTFVSGPNDPYSEELHEGEAGIRMLAVDPARQGR